MHRPHALTRGDYVHLSLRTCTLLLSTTALSILIHILLSFQRTFSLSISGTSYALSLDISVLLLFATRYRPLLRQVIKWLWFLELGVVILLAISFAKLGLSDFGREAGSDGFHGYVYRDAEDLGWRIRGAWVLLGVFMVAHFGFMVLGCVDAFREKRRGRFDG